MKKTKKYIQLSLLPDDYRQQMFDDLVRDEKSFPLYFWDKRQQKWLPYTDSERAAAIKQYIDKFFNRSFTIAKSKRPL